MHDVDQEGAKVETSSLNSQGEKALVVRCQPVFSCYHHLDNGSSGSGGGPQWRQHNTTIAAHPYNYSGKDTNCKILPRKGTKERNESPLIKGRVGGTGGLSQRETDIRYAILFPPIELASAITRARAVKA